MQETHLAGAVPTKRLKEPHQTDIGFWVLEVPHDSHPEFDFKAAKIGMEQVDIQTELLRNWKATSGLRVYPEFNPDIHVATDNLDYDPNLPLHIGLDFGLSPAACIAQLSAFGQLSVFPSLHPEEREYEGIYAFGQKLADHLLKEYAQPNDLTLEEIPLVFVGDPAGRARVAQRAAGKTAREMRSCFEVLYRGLDLHLGEDETGRSLVEKLPGFGWRVIAGDVSNFKRQEAVRHRLNSLVHGLPAFLLDPREEFIESCFMGLYHIKEYADGTHGRDPEKNEASHIMDALSYLCTRLSYRPEKKEEDTDTMDLVRPDPWCSQASSRWRYG